MPTARLLLLFCLSATVAGSGCTTHRALKHNTVHQALTVSDIHRKQVLNNLAKFIYDPYALPDFAWPNAGSDGVNDTGTLNFNLIWTAMGFGTGSFGGSGSRAASQSWTLTPINDPRKLELMRCAYQRAIASCGYGFESPTCPNCVKRFNAFYTGRPFGTDMEERVLRDDADNNMSAIKNVVPTPDPSSVQAAGIVNSECLQGPCWFDVCCKKCKHDKCDEKYTGEYCGVHVYVPPSGRDELTRLVLTILDFAVNDAPAARLKQVTAYLMADGTNATPSSAERVVSTSIPLSASVESIQSVPSRRTAFARERAEVEVQIESVRALIDAEMDAVKKAELQGRLRSLDHRKDVIDQIIAGLGSPDADAKPEMRMRYNQLQSEHVEIMRLPPAPTPVPNAGFLQFNQSLQALTPQR